VRVLPILVQVNVGYSGRSRQWPRQPASEPRLKNGDSRNKPKPVRGRIEIRRNSIPCSLWQTMAQHAEAA
jgi:hypothetical protein